MKKLNRKEASLGKNKVVGFAWVGRWVNGEIGWAMPKTISGWPSHTDYSRWDAIEDGHELTLCKVTVEVVGNKNGKEIKKRFKR